MISIHRTNRRDYCFFSCSEHMIREIVAFSAALCVCVLCVLSRVCVCVCMWQCGWVGVSVYVSVCNHVVGDWVWNALVLMCAFTVLALFWLPCWYLCLHLQYLRFFDCHVDIYVCIYSTCAFLIAMLIFMSAFIVLALFWFSSGCWCW